MKNALAEPARRLRAKSRPTAAKRPAAEIKSSAKPWSPPDFARRLKEDFGGKIMPFSYVDHLER